MLLKCTFQPHDSCNLLESVAKLSHCHYDKNVFGGWSVGDFFALWQCQGVSFCTYFVTVPPYVSLNPPTAHPLPKYWGAKHISSPQKILGTQPPRHPSSDPSYAILQLSATRSLSVCMPSIYYIGKCFVRRVSARY